MRGKKAKEQNFNKNILKEKKTEVNKKKRKKTHIFRNVYKVAFINTLF